MYNAINVLVTSLLGTLSGLGIGSGSLLMLWLTVFKKEEYSNARIINLLFFIPAALVSCISSRHTLYLQRNILVPAVICGAISALIFSILSRNWDIVLLKKLFGVLMLAAGIRELRAKR